MELKELAVKVKQLFGAREIEDIPDRITQILTSPERNGIFEKYIELTGDLATDHLQRIHQFWAADREEKKQDFTPASIADLAAALTAKEGTYTLYDICAGSGALTIAQWRKNPNIEVLCEELDERVIPLLLFNLAIRNIAGRVVNKNVLTGETHKAYKLTRGEKYSSVEEAGAPQPRKFDAVISNPPYNIPWPPVIDERFICCEESIQKLKNNANCAFILHALHHLKPDGTAALILPMGSLSSSTPEQKVRAYLAEENIIDAVIAMPENMFESTGIPTCILALKRGSEAAGGIEFIDAKKTCGEDIRLQRGEGNACHANRIYRKAINVFSHEHIEKITAAVRGRTTEPEFSRLAAIEDIRGNEYNIVPAQYIEHRPEEHKHRPFEEIAAEINKITKERNAVKITMNENTAKEFGLYELGEDIKQSNLTTENMNEWLKPLGISFAKDDYFSLSKNAKEIKVENRNKDEVSSLFKILIPMYKQHLYYLNERENELLAELRDALLPELMSGRIRLAK